MALLLCAMKNAPMTEGPYPIDRSVRERMAASLRRQLAHYPTENVARTIGQFPSSTEANPSYPAASICSGSGVPRATQRCGWLRVVTVNVGPAYSITSLARSSIFNN